MNIIGFLAVITASVVMLVKTTTASKVHQQPPKRGRNLTNHSSFSSTPLAMSSRPSRAVSDLTSIEEYSADIHSVSSRLRALHFPSLLCSQLATPKSHPRLRHSRSRNDHSRPEHPRQPQRNRHHTSRPWPPLLAHRNRLRHPRLHPRLSQSNLKLHLPRPPPKHHRPSSPRPRCRGLTPHSNPHLKPHHDDQPHGHSHHAHKIRSQPPPTRDPP